MQNLMTFYKKFLEKKKTNKHFSMLSATILWENIRLEISCEMSA